MENRTVLSAYTVSTAADNGDNVYPIAGSLRAAILAANAHRNNFNLFGLRDLIVFSIPGTGPHTIRPLSGLPAIEDPVILDATTQPGYAGKPIIELDGSLAPDEHGLNLTGGNILVRGFVINRFAPAVTGATSLINISGPNNVVQGCYLGTNLAGDAIFPAATQATYGITVFPSSGNVLGTNGDGANDAAEGNVISGQSLAGIALAHGAANNVVAGNRIGTDVAGNRSLGNGAYGVVFIGAGPRNRIGTNGDGRSDLFERNIISGNLGTGIFIDSDDNVVAGNDIGSTSAGSIPLPNSSGVWIQNGSNNMIGGTRLGTGNVIAFNTAEGVVVRGSGVGNSILQNTIYNNGGLGIDLGGDGVTSNDDGDLDTGPNHLANFPEIASALVAGPDVFVNGRITFGPEAQSAWKRIEFFVNYPSDMPEPSGQGAGRYFLGSVDLRPNIAETATDFSATLFGGGAILPGAMITATVTSYLRPTVNLMEASPSVALSPITVGPVLPSAKTLGTSEFSRAAALSYLAQMIDGNLVVTGTAANDRITVDATNPNSIDVTFNGRLLYPGGSPFAVNPWTGRVIIFGGAGDDVIEVTGWVDSEIHGGAGNDIIYGGTGYDVIWGDAGDDTILGRGGSNVLIGGAGQDRLRGGSGNDLLIGGSLREGPQHNGVEAYDYGVLRRILEDWKYRVLDLDFYYSRDDIIDTERDVLYGGSGSDWFVANIFDTLPDYFYAEGDLANLYELLDE